MSARLEAFLARLYVDAHLRAAYSADAETEATRAGLEPAERSALLRIDVVDLALAARSFAAKRAHKARPRWCRRFWK